MPERGIASRVTMMNNMTQISCTVAARRFYLESDSLGDVGHYLACNGYTGSGLQDDADARASQVHKHVDTCSPLDVTLLYTLVSTFKFHPLPDSIELWQYDTTIL